MGETAQTAEPRWAIVEIMGHRVVAGRLVWGEPLPDGSFLQEFYGAARGGAELPRAGRGGGAIFSVRLVPEEVVRALLPAARDVDARPPGRESIYRDIDGRIERPGFDPAGDIGDALQALEENKGVRDALVLLAALAVSAIAKYDEIEMDGEEDEGAF